MIEILIPVLKYSLGGACVLGAILAGCGIIVGAIRLVRSAKEFTDVCFGAAGVLVGFVVGVGGPVYVIVVVWFISNGPGARLP